MKSYQAHLQSIKSFGETIKPKRKPIYRASAIFPVFQNMKLNTRILFMGYWLVKRQFTEIGLLITLRGQYGRILYRDNWQITTPEAKEIHLKEILEKIGFPEEEFLGSIELEVFSSRDLVFPYPAFVINYFNEYGSGVVHTTGRIYNDFEDMKSNESMLVKECGFDILSSEEYDPFFTFVNGHLPLEENIIELEIIDETGNCFLKKLNLGKLEALETVLFKFKDHLPLSKILNNKTGTVKIKHQLKGFFPRFIAGNFCKHTEATSITHTYYDNANNSTKGAYWSNDHTDILYDSAVYVPLLLHDDWYTTLKLYPIYSPSNHTMTVQFYDENGGFKGEVKNFKSIQSDKSEYISVDFGELIESNKLDKNSIKGAYLVKNWTNKDKIPTRIKYGLNIGRKGKIYDIPTNICFASGISNVKILQKKGTFKWLPLLNEGDSLAIIENSSYVKNYTQAANLEVRFYKRDKEEVISRQYSIPPHGQIQLTVDSELGDFLEGHAGWMTIKSDNPFVKAWYFELNDSGVIGGDHSF